MNKKNLVLFSAPVLFMVLLLARGESPIIKWQPERIDISVFQGGARLIDIEFIANPARYAPWIVGFFTSFKIAFIYIFKTRLK